MRRFLPLLAAFTLQVSGQSPCDTRHLTIFDAGVAEYLQERSFPLQLGLNTLEFRSLMPQAVVRTLRVTGDQLTVVRQNVSYDGPEVRGQRRPVLHLVVRNDGAASARKLQVDYLAPALSWKGDYSLLLMPTTGDAPPREMQLDGWVTIQNDTAVDICAGAVDLVAGEVQLQTAGGRAGRQFQANSQMMTAQAARFDAAESAEVAGVSVFSRFRMGTDVSMNASQQINRFPLLQRARWAVEQRNVFENEFNTQTLGRGGFMLQPRGLEVRLVSRNGGTAPLAAGSVTVYSQEGGLPQVVGQDNIPLTPPGADFSVTQGRSNLMQGTRRVTDRHEVPDLSASATRRRARLVTTVEVTVFNRGASKATAHIREGVEQFGNGEWSVTANSHPHQKLGSSMLEFRVEVPAKGETKVSYTVETR